MTLRPLVLLLVLGFLGSLGPMGTVGMLNMKTPFSILESFLNILRTAVKYQSEWVPQVDVFKKEYDFIVVGGGTAGCVMASRLSANPSVSVLLLEAGTDEFYIYDIPILANYFQLTESSWKHRTMRQNSACLGLKNEKCNMPRGKVLGGSSSINYMIYTRGHPRDYDRWRDLGNPGWGWSDLEPYFRRIEDCRIPEYCSSNKFRGEGGPVKLAHPPYHTILAEAFLQAGAQMGYGVQDYNGARMAAGFGYIQATMNNGTRWTSNRGYIMPVRDRPNLHVSKLTRVTKLLIDPVTRRCLGVELVRDGRRHQVLATREVILSAGALNTPQILMLSGIGPRDHLQSLGIPLILDSPGVGSNLQDHIALGGFTFVVDQNVSLNTDRIIDDASALVDYFAFHKGPLAVPGGMEALGFVSTPLNPDPDYPDVELLFGGGCLGGDTTLRACLGIKNEIYHQVYRPLEGTDAYTIFPMLLRPESSGRVLLRSKNPFTLPLVQHGYLTKGRDLAVIVEGAKIALRLANTPAMRKFGAKVHDIPLPACKHLKFGSSAYWGCATRQLTLNIYHQCCTARMGPDFDSGAVLDHRLRVRGIRGLRVVDASIMPAVISGHTNGPVFVIAERAADMVIQDWAMRSL